METGLFSGVQLENCKIMLENTDKYEDVQLNADGGYLWENPVDDTQISWQAKQNVTGTVTPPENGKRRGISCMVKSLRRKPMTKIKGK